MTANQHGTEKDRTGKLALAIALANSANPSHPSHPSNPCTQPAAKRAAALTNNMLTRVEQLVAAVTPERIERATLPQISTLLRTLLGREQAISLANAATAETLNQDRQRLAEAVTRHVKDPDTIRAIVQEINGIGEIDSIAPGPHKNDEYEEVGGPGEVPQAAPDENAAQNDDITAPDEPTAPPASPADDLREIGDHHLAQPDYDNALIAYQKAAAADLPEPEPHEPLEHLESQLCMVVTYVRTSPGQYNQARITYQNAMNQARARDCLPKPIAALFFEANPLRTLLCTPAAPLPSSIAASISATIPLWETAVALYRGWRRLIEGQHQQATTYFREALAHRPNLADTHLLLSHCLQQTGATAQAAAALQQAHSLIYGHEASARIEALIAYLAYLTSSEIPPTYKTNVCKLPCT